MIELRVNSIDRTFDGDPEMPLLWYLRDTLGLTGTKFGCGIALCGAEIRTIEDVGARGLYPV
jgi:isoquinoline 1-oxidoreductase subunit alpha